MSRTVDVLIFIGVDTILCHKRLVRACNDILKIKYCSACGMGSYSEIIVAIHIAREFCTRKDFILRRAMYPPTEFICEDGTSWKIACGFCVNVAYEPKFNRKKELESRQVKGVYKKNNNLGDGGHYLLEHLDDKAYHKYTGHIQEYAYKSLLITIFNEKEATDASMPFSTEFKA